jgi:hypothetical protein
MLLSRFISRFCLTSLPIHEDQIMTNPSDNLIAQFLLCTLSKQALGTYQLMTKLKYPLTDRKTLIDQLECLRKDVEKVTKDEKESIQLIQSFLTPLDFPILSIQSGLEKLHIKLPPRFIFPDLLNPRDTLERPIPDVQADYIRRFGAVCGARAYATYLDFRRGFPEVTAYKAGLDEGERCANP